MKILLKPEKKQWQVWKRDRYLKSGKDYLIENERIVFAKCFKGKLEFEYNYTN